MTAMFPDSGVPWTEARNSLNDPSSKHCNELWYSTSRCEPRFDPAAANAMLAELILLINKGEVTYDCNFLNQVELAVRYLIQRGIPHGGSMAMGPLDYTLALDPPLTRYNDHLTLVVVPQVTNNGPVRVNVNGLGLVPVLRNDFKPLEDGDLWGKVPALISFWNGVFYHVGLVRSQVALLGGIVDGWIRTDGSDLNDGTANTPDKAFRTINGAFAALGTKYAQTPGFVLNLRLGRPGIYESARFVNSGQTIVLTGDLSNPTAYQIKSALYPSGDSIAVYISDCRQVTVQGVMLLMDLPGRITGLRNEASGVRVRNVTWQQYVSNDQAFGITVSSGYLYMSGNLNYNGAGTLAALMFLNGNASVVDGGEATPHLWTVYQTNFVLAALCVSTLSLLQWGPRPPVLTATTGPRYGVTMNGVLNAGGAPLPGSTAGTVTTGGQYVA